MKIGLTSDTHIGITTYKLIRRCFEELAAQVPDIVVHAGDFCGGHTGYKSVRSTCRLLRDVFPTTPILAVLGNHDYWCGKPKGHGWVSVDHGTPPLSAYLRNLEKIRDAFKSSTVHFLDDDGAYRDVRFPGLVIIGHSGWYKHYVTTNDYSHLPTGLGGDTLRHMQRGATYGLEQNIAQLGEGDTRRVFVSHFPVIEPREYGWDAYIGDALQDLGFRHFLNGHFHERHEGPLRFEAGSDYGSPRYLVVNID